MFLYHSIPNLLARNSLKCNIKEQEKEIVLAGQKVFETVFLNLFEHILEGLERDLCQKDWCLHPKIQIQRGKQRDAFLVFQPPTDKRVRGFVNDTNQFIYFIRF